MVIKQDQQSDLANGSTILVNLNGENVRSRATTHSLNVGPSTGRTDKVNLFRVRTYAFRNKMNHYS
jgi:hypothetical protein